ncbi:MAG: helix-turn-helix domain-containing protein [Myxococcota bacterium]
MATTPAQLTLAKAVSLLGLTPNEVSRIYTARKRKRLGIDELADGLTVLPAKAHSRVDESRLGVLSVSEAARRLEVSRRTIQDAARAGDLATAAGTNGTYVLDKDLERWWQRHRSNFEARSRSAELKRRWSMDR